MAMADKTYLAQLETARTQIIKGGQSGTIGDLSYPFPTITEINKEIATVRKRLARASGKRPSVVSIQTSGMGYN